MTTQPTGVPPIPTGQLAELLGEHGHALNDACYCRCGAELDPAKTYGDSLDAHVAAVVAEFMAQWIEDNTTVSELVVHGGDRMLTRAFPIVWLPPLVVDDADWDFEGEVET